MALGLDAACGYPPALYRTIRHPVVWAGTLIAALDRHLNRPELGFRQRRARGIAAVLALLLAALLPALALEAVARGAAGIVLLALLTSPLLAQRSLHDHVRAVADALERGGLAAGREAVSHIVGRNPAFLDEAGVARAAIESLAENFSDGVVAPAFWAAALGLPGIAAYKAVNTADSMIGHRTERHAAFGWAAARLDDLINLPGSRLAALWLILAACLLPGASPAKAARGMRRDARHHRSPNAGWPEAAMAGALGLRLNGPRVYGDARVEDAWMGDGRDNATAADVRRALRLYRLACAINLGAVLAALAVV
ncbi:MAG TPA: adenosylcobinamide-phosphate synthase CbiB [Acetobacteraceae bacterium]|nr:adenosylcobinamide-phosphate synthase CbiB [Acetobacteraceae bacterium]